MGTKSDAIPSASTISPTANNIRITFSWRRSA